MENTISFQFGNYDLADYKQQTEDRGFFTNHINPQYSEAGLTLADAVRQFAKEVSMQSDVKTSFAFTNEPMAGSPRRFEAYGLSYHGRPFASVVVTNDLIDEVGPGYIGENVDDAIRQLEYLSRPLMAAFWPDGEVSTRGLQFAGPLHQLQRLMLGQRDKCKFAVTTDNGRLVVKLGLKDGGDTMAVIRLVTDEDDLWGQLVETDATGIEQAPAEAQV